MTSRIRTILLVAILGTALALAGCASGAGSANTDPAAVEGSWQLEAFGGTTDLQPADPAVTTTMDLKGGQASGNGGVNSFSGAYETPQAGALEFGPTMSTKMAGPEAAMKQEDQFFKALANTKHFEIKDGKLVLSDTGNNTLAVLVAK